MKRSRSSFRRGLPVLGSFLVLACMTPAPVSQGQEARDGTAAMAGQWAQRLVGSLLRHGGTRGAKLALQPLDPADFAGLDGRQRRRLHGRMLQALADEALGRFDLVDRASLADVARALEDSPDPRWHETYLQVLKQAHARINIVCRSTPGAVSLIVECKATDIRDGRALASPSASFALDWLNRPIALDLAVGSIARDIASHIGRTGRLAGLRIVDGRTDKASGLSRYVANALEHSIDRHMRVDQGAVGRAEFRVDGEILEAGSGRERLLLNVRLFSGDERLQLFQEHVARSSAPLLDPVDPPEASSPSVGCGTDGEVANRLLPAGYTLGDWRLLATDRLKRRDYVRLVVEAKAHLRDHCKWSGAREVLDLAVSGLAAGIRLSGEGDARHALARIAEIAGSAGEHPVLLGLRARAHRLLGEYVQEEEAHRRWLGLAPETHPERRETLLALMRARSAVSDGERFSALLGRPFSATAKEESAGWTDLHYAAALNLPGAVTALVDAGMAADVRLRGDSSRFSNALQGILIGLGHEEVKGWTAAGDTPLMIAAVAKAYEAAAALLDAGADINAKDNAGKTPLHLAAWGNARETAEWLVAHGADIRAKDKWGNRGNTPLHWAARGNARETAEWLVGRGADINAKNNYDITPLHHAALRNARETAEWLVGRGADINAKNKGGETPLHHAALRNARETAEWLVGRGADINAKNKGGETPLHYAARTNARETLEWLVGRGADINAKDNSAQTPLHEAAWGNARETAEWLVAHGADIRAKDKWGNRGNTPLHWAARGNARETAEWLVGRGADINAKNNYDITPLHHAALRNARETAEWLVGRGADINAKNKGGETPLHYAARTNARETLEWLVGRGADINAKDNNAQTPLHEAAWGNARETAEWLAGRGADINAKDNAGKTPLDRSLTSTYGREQDRTATRAMLRRLGGQCSTKC